MKVTVVSDKKGNIIALVKRPSEGKVTFELRPLPKQQVDEIDLPPEFENEDLNLLHDKLRVERSGNTARFVKVTKPK